MAGSSSVKKFLGWLFILIVTFVIGSGFAIYKVHTWKNDSQQNIGGWNTIGKDKDVNNNDLLSIAQIAVYATYPLTKKEVIYLNTNKDKDGNLLTTENDYVIEGKKLDARYWSITAYDQDGFLIKNKDNRYSFNNENTSYEADSLSFKLTLSSKEKSNNWLPSGNAKSISLVIRLYQPSDSLRNNLNTSVLPTVRKVN